jgi:hypothetical protein
MAETTGYLVRELASGDTMVFSRHERAVYVVAGAGVKELRTDENPVAGARKLVAEGRGKHFDHEALAGLQEALSGIVLLGASPESTESPTPTPTPTPPQAL